MVFQRRKLKVYLIGWLLVTLVCCSPLVGNAEGLFSVFRTDNRAAWAIDPSDFVKLLEAIEGRERVVQIANFGEVEILAQPVVEKFYLGPSGEVHFAGRNLTVPTQIEGFKPVQAQKVSASKLRFTLNVPNINRFLSSLSVRAVVPIQVNNKPFYLNTAELVICSYAAIDPRASDLVIAITLPSELEVPPSVNPADLRDAVLAIPGLPKGLKTQFANVTQGRALLSPEGLGEEILIRNGLTGYYTVGPYGLFKWEHPLSPEGEQFQKEIQRSFNQKNVINSLWGMRLWADSLSWLEKGLIVLVMGELSPQQACAVAEMIR